MQLIRGIGNIRPEHHGCVLTIGKFDGVHLGHQAVCKNLIYKAKQLKLPSSVMVFEPQPEEFFAPEKAPPRLSSLRDKYSQLKKLGIDRLICIRFEAGFAKQSPTHFVEELLKNKLGTKFLVVGDDFKFGFQRKGDFAFLQRISSKCGFEVVNTKSYQMNDDRVSSTLIRQALRDGDFSAAKNMLGRNFSLFGRVVHGEKNGRTIGFPTANIKIKSSKLPISGVFAVKAYMNGQEYKGVANLGYRPTLAGQQLQLETHLFAFSGNLYGCVLTVHFVDKIRDEKRFESLDELKQQIKKDALMAKTILSEDK
ncbi:MAG: bifunctional riboflavin kinase/FAD synthetase [Pseudomonadota bacterium]